MIGRRRKPRPWSNTAAATGWGESTFAEIAWDKSRGAATRWAVFGAFVGVLIGVVVFAPAAWLASAIASATGQHRVIAQFVNKTHLANEVMEAVSSVAAEVRA